MRKMFLLLLAFLLSGRAISQSNGWFVPGETPTTSTLNDICTLTADTAIAVGDNGVILKTTDGGISWIVLSGGTSVHLQSVYFVNSKIGWAVGRDRTILKTLDGGETWAQQFSTMANRHGYDVFFINATTGWNVCRDDWPGYVAIVYRTSNGGNSWNSTLTGVGDNLNSLHFANTLLGWVVGNGGAVLKTVDGGTNWTSKLSGTSDNLISLGSLDDLTLIAVGHNGTIIKTSDGGENWSRVSSGVAEKLLAVGFADGQQGWIVGESGVILHTTNGGVSWGKQISGTSNLLRSISFITTQIGWAVGQNGTVIKTTNNGGVTLFPPTLLSPADQSTDISASTSLQWNSCAGATSYHIQLAQDISFSSSLLDQAGVETTSLTATGLTANSIYYWRVKTYYPEGASNWSEVFSFTTAGSGWIPAISGVTSNLRSVFFVSSNTGWAVGDAGTLLKTSGGGVSWNKKSINFSRTLTDIFFINESVGWTVGGWTSSIFKTTNGGDHWLAKSVGEELSFHSVQFINEFTGWAVADYDIFGTTDGGDNWQKLSSINSDLLVDAQFLSATTGWIIGWNDIYKTTDSGRTWINKTNGSLNLDLSEDLAHICLIDEKNGWVVSEAGRIFKTSDGESWSLVYSCEDCRLSTIMFIDQTTGWCAGESGMLLKTTDGGSSWGVQKSRTTRHLQSAYFIDSATGWLVGDNGIILRTKDGGGALQPPVEDQLINQNGGFEEATIGEKYGNDISGWTLWFDTQASATYKVVDNPVKEGNRALMLTAKALGANSWSIQAVNEPFTVKPDSVYTFSIWIKADKNGSVVIFTVGDPSYNEWKRTNKIVVTTQWQLVTFQFTAPHTASTGRAPIHFSDLSNSTYLPVTYYLDDLQIKKWRQSAEISEEKQQITSFALRQNYPNPFNTETTIQYQLPATTQVKLEIFDLLGKKVATLVDRWHASGSYAVRWNGKDEANKNVASGLYLYRLQAKGFVSTRKLVLVQ